MLDLRSDRPHLRWMPSASAAGEECVRGRLRAGVLSRAAVTEVLPVAMSSDPFYCDWDGKLTVETASGQAAVGNVLVMCVKPLGVELVFCVSGISAPGGVLIESQ